MYPLCFEVVWQLGAQEILCERKEEWIPPDIKTFLRLILGQSRHWSWREVGYSTKPMIQSIPRNKPWSTSREDRWRFWNSHHSPQTWILLKICGDLKHAVHARRPNYISSLEMSCQEEWGEIPKVRIERLSAGYRNRLQAAMLPEEEFWSTHWQGSQTFAQILFCSLRYSL